MRFRNAQNPQGPADGAERPELQIDPEQAPAGSRSRAARRSPLILGALSVSAGLVLAGCTPSTDDEPDESASASEEQSQDESSADESAGQETSTESSAESSDGSSSESSESASDEASEGASDDASEDDDEGEGSAAASGDVVELSGLPDTEPVQSESGTGKAEFALEHPDGDDAPVYTSRSASGEGSAYAYFTGQRSDGSTTSMGGVAPGTTGVGFEDPYWMDDRITDVEVDAPDDVEWTFDVYSVDEIPDVEPGQSVKGNGSKVFHWTGGEAGSFDVVSEADGNFIVKAETTDPDGPTAQTIFNEIGQGEGTMELPAEEYFITVESRGPWEFTAK